MIALLTTNVVRQDVIGCLEEVGWNVVPVEPIMCKGPAYRDWFCPLFTKLVLWNMTQYDLVAYLDGYRFNSTKS